jgi:hypothetical protein
MKKTNPFSAPKATRSGLATVSILAIGLGVIAVVILVWQLSRRSSSGSAAIDGVQTFSNLKRDHVPGRLTYDQKPPVGGVHDAVWQNCGIYDTQIPLENAVHSLEHGAVWVAYQPNLADAEVKILRDLVRGKSHTLLAPYQYGVLNKPVVAVAWGLKLELDRVDDPRLEQFVTRYANGSQAPEPGETCSGGTGTPIE